MCTSLTPHLGAFLDPWSNNEWKKIKTQKKRLTGGKQTSWLIMFKFCVKIWTHDQTEQFYLLVRVGLWNHWMFSVVPRPLDVPLIIPSGQSTVITVGDQAAMYCCRGHGFHCYRDYKAYEEQRPLFCHFFFSPYWVQMYYYFQQDLGLTELNYSRQVPAGCWILREPEFCMGLA